MNWSDERYVKLYTRQTPTTLSWQWETVAVWPNLLARVDQAGVLDCGRLGHARAVAVTTRLPIAVVEVALKELEADGTVELTERALIVPNFIAAQEACKTDAQKKRDQRERHKDKVRAESSGIIETHVTGRHRESPDVTGCPPPAQPSPAQINPSPDLFPLSLEAQAADADVTRVVKKAIKDAKKPPNPRHAPLVARLDAAARRVLGSYAFTPRDAKAASELLHKGTDEEVEARLVKAFAAGGYPLVRTIHELNTHWNHFATDKPTGGFQRPRHPGAPVEPKPFNTGEDLGF